MFSSLNKLSLFAFLVVMASCGAKTANNAGTALDTATTESRDANLVDLTPDQYKSIGVQLGNITYTNLSNYIKASGMIDVPPQQTISITSPYGGIVRSTSVVEGKYISKGQVVATLENPEFIQLQQDYLEGNSQLNFLRQDLARQEELVKENIAARKSLQRVGSDYNAMMARVEGLKTRLRQINISPSSVQSGRFTSRVSIIAPTGGYVTKVYTNTGKYLNANEAVAEIVNTNSIQVNINVFEKDIPKIHLGQRIRFRATGDSMERNAAVFLIGKDINGDRTVNVFGRITSPSKSLLPGMFINAILEIGSSSTPALPQQAIVQGGGTNYIFVLETNNAKPAEAKEAAAAGEAAGGEQSHIVFRRVEVGVTVTENGYTGVILPENFDLKSKVLIKGAYDLLSKMNNAGEEEE